MKSSYRFLKVPLCLFSDSYSQLSVEAKILYAFLLDRLTLSEKNGFLDEDGSVFVYYTNSEVCISRMLFMLISLKNLQIHYSRTMIINIQE